MSANMSLVLSSVNGECILVETHVSPSAIFLGGTSYPITGTPTAVKTLIAYDGTNYSTIALSSVTQSVHSIVTHPGDILYRNADELVKLPRGNKREVLQMSNASVPLPEWNSVTHSGGTDSNINAASMSLVGAGGPGGKGQFSVRGMTDSHTDAGRIETSSTGTSGIYASSATSSAAGVVLSVGLDGAVLKSVSGVQEWLGVVDVSATAPSAATTGRLWLDTTAGSALKVYDGTSWNWTGAGILDEDAMGSNSNKHLATQQSIKAYVDGQTHAAALTQEQVEDYAGAVVATGGTKTGITVTYQDGTGDMDFVVAAQDHGSLTGKGDDDHSQYIYNAPAGSNRNLITQGSAARPPFSIKKHATGSSDLLQILDSGDNEIVEIDNNANLFVSGTATATSGTTDSVVPTNLLCFSRQFHHTAYRSGSFTDGQKITVFVNTTDADANFIIPAGETLKILAAYGRCKTGGSGTSTWTLGIKTWDDEAHSTASYHELAEGSTASNNVFLSVVGRGTLASPLATIVGDNAPVGICYIQYDNSSASSSNDKHTIMVYGVFV